MFGKKEFRFKGRRHSARGNGSFVVGVLNLAVFFIISFVSGLAGGNGPAVLGAVGILCFFAAIAGFILSYKSFREKDIYYVAPIAGVIINGLMVVLFLALYFIGILS